MLSGYLFRFLAYCTVLACLLVPSNIFANQANPDPIIYSVTRQGISEGDKMIVIGEFGAKPESIKLKYKVEKDDKEIDVKGFLESNENKIEFKVPEDFPTADTMVSILQINGSDLKAGPQNEFLVQNPALNLFVKKAIELKKGLNADESFVLEFISNEQQKDINKNPKDYKDKRVLFQGSKLNISEIDALTTSGFSQDFIGKLVGLPQYVTFGFAAVWLYKNHDLVPSPMLRIFRSPKSYFAPRAPLFSKKTWWEAIKERVDLNFGYTVKSETDSGSESTTTNYVLAGFSYEINRAALLNIGVAMAAKDVENDKTQVYFGLTVDSNLLKQLGIIGKD